MTMLFACESDYYGDYTYQDFEHLDHWDDLATLGDDSIDLVYYYNRDFLGTSCSGCEIVQEEVFKFGKENNLNVQLILINDREIQGQRPLGLRTQPRLFLVEEGVITKNELGASPILEWLEEIEQGDYTFDQEPVVEYAYDDALFNHINDWETDLDNIAQEVDYYLVYSYLEACGACQSIKNEVLTFAADNDANLSLYLADAAKVSLSNSNEFRPGESGVVPTLLIMQGNELVDERIGTVEIIDALEALNNGDYVFD